MMKKTLTLKNYLFEDRDLVLLDWNLRRSNLVNYILWNYLQRLSIGRPHIHFCAIYTSEKWQKIRFSILITILSYFFRVKTEEYYLQLREQIESN
jgi:hypothetical protein